MKNPKFTWDEESGSCLCIIQDKNKIYYGTATCGPEDQDMKSQNTGSFIAMSRATIKALKGKKEQFKQKRQGLLELYYDVIYNKQYNDNDFLAKRLKRKINQYSKDINTISSLIEEEQKCLEQYIEDKDKFYRLIRAKREKAKSN